MRVLKPGLIVLFVLGLTSCSEKPLVKTETSLLMPPQALLQDCPQTPVPEFKNNGELFDYLLYVSLDLKECSQSKAKLREWYERMNSSQGGETE